MEVGKMPAQRNTNQSKRLTAAGLIAVTAATLLLMGWAILPNAAFANGTVTWTGNGTSGGKLDTQKCDESNTPYLLWIFPIGGQNTITSVTLSLGGSGSGSFTVNSTDTDVSNDTSGFTGGSVHIRTPFFDLSTLTASISYVGELGNGEHKLVISHGCPGETPPTTTTVPVTTTTVPTTTTTVPTTTTTVPTTTTTVPGGGGGGPTTTTTTIPTVAPTTIHKTTATETTTDEVLATTVRPGGTAFTGVENVVPIGAIALMLMTSGSGLLWAGSRRRRRDGSEDEN
jgi:hypothetical protein